MECCREEAEREAERSTGQRVAAVRKMGTVEGKSTEAELVKVWEAVAAVDVAAAEMVTRKMDRAGRTSMAAVTRSHAASVAARVAAKVGMESTTTFQ